MSRRRRWDDEFEDLEDDDDEYGFLEDLEDDDDD